MSLWFFLIEGGQSLLGNAFDEGLVDEVHCFIARKIVGGATYMFEEFWQIELYLHLCLRKSSSVAGLEIYSMNCRFLQRRFCLPLALWTPRAVAHSCSFFIQCYSSFHRQDGHNLR